MSQSKVYYLQRTEMFDSFIITPFFSSIDKAFEKAIELAEEDKDNEEEIVVVKDSEFEGFSPNRVEYQNSINLIYIEIIETEVI